MDQTENLDKYLIKEIELIQEIIKRMASNSFLIKGWTITLVVATLLLKGNNLHIFIAFIPLVSFWILDAYFLRQERMYRELYKWVINNRHNTSDFLFDLNAYRFKEKVTSIWGTMISSTLLCLYGSILLLLVLYIISFAILQGNIVICWC